MNARQTLLWIQGEVGRLETLYQAPVGVARGVAVIHHPNPTQGGTFTNKVVQTIAKTLAQMGFHCYLPNSRGTGNSEGEHDFGRGEAVDLVKVIDFAKSQHPEAPQLLIAGFSFGGFVATFTAQQRQPDLLLLVGAAVGHYAEPAPAVPDVQKTLLIHGADDEVVALSKPLQWAGGQGLPVIVIPESSHFFHGKLIPLRDCIKQFAPAILAQSSVNASN